MICKLTVSVTTVSLYVSFYINYVICKFEVYYLNNQIKKRFILTMWYVNLKIILKKDLCDIGFILTMWYVNLIDWGYSITGALGFILTMWYVNE